MQEPLTEQTRLIDRMQQQISTWETSADRRAIFLTCYSMMTRNMLTAVDRGEFQDSAWVTTLLNDFAGYYFDALEAYENAPDDMPPVWKLAFDSAAHTQRGHVLQHLILGVNAHINYDLVFVVFDLLHDGWREIDPDLKARRYADYCHVNEIISRTINSVQDEVVKRYSPMMNLVDTGFFSLDEMLLHRLICRWRESVWRNACRLMSCTEADAPQIKHLIDSQCVRRGQAILLEHGVFGLRYIF